MLAISLVCSGVALAAWLVGWRSGRRAGWRDGDQRLMAAARIVGKHGIVPVPEAWKAKDGTPLWERIAAGYSERDKALAAVRAELAGVRDELDATRKAHEEAKLER